MLVHIKLGQAQRSGQRVPGNVLAASRNQMEIRFRGADPDSDVIGGIDATNTDSQGSNEDDASVLYRFGNR